MNFLLRSAIVSMLSAIAVFAAPYPFNFLSLAIGALALGLNTAVSSVVQIETGMIGVGKSFGKTFKSSFGPGINLVKPWTDIVLYDGLRMEFPYEGIVIANDQNPLTVSIGFAIRLNPDLAWRIQTTVGEDYFANLIVPAGQTAVREGFAAFSWTLAATSSRDEVQAKIDERFKHIVTRQLIAAGLSEQEASSALSFSPVQLRQSLPDQKVLNAVAEKTAAQQDLERQETLTKISQEEAKRRSHEGDGVKNLFDKLPDNFSPDDIFKVLSALSAKTRADAMLKAVESGEVKTVIMNGDTGANVAATIRND
jgi:regulator of protease activity HflC (stomatin/prohibitin superfamily)